MDRNNETTSTSLAQIRKTRVCPYCDKRIPASEDPCQHCGHLEPAEIAPKVQKEDLRIYVVLLLLGVAMLIWPGTNDPGIYICEPGKITSCLINNIWGIPLGISMVTCCLLNLAWGVLSNARIDKVEPTGHSLAHGGRHAQKSVAAH
jgi:hypothetical protein